MNSGSCLKSMNSTVDRLNRMLKEVHKLENEDLNKFKLNLVSNRLDKCLSTYAKELESSAKMCIYTQILKM